MKIKITESQLKQLIKEEANRYRKVLELQKRREEIIKQINEMYEGDFAMEEDSFDEGIFDTVKDFLRPNPEQKRAEIEAFVQNHPAYSSTAAKVAERTGQSVEDVHRQLIDFLTKEATLADGQLKGVLGGISYDAKNRRFINKTKLSNYGPSGNEF